MINYSVGDFGRMTGSWERLISMDATSDLDRYFGEREEKINEICLENIEVGFWNKENIKKQGGNRPGRILLCPATIRPF